VLQGAGAQSVGIALAGLGQGDDAQGNDLVDERRLALVVERCAGFFMGRARHLDLAGTEGGLCEQVYNLTHSTDSPHRRDANYTR
jgi:hypothetical protein